MSGHDPEPSDDRATLGAAEKVRLEERIAREQGHLPEGRPPGDRAMRLSVRIAFLALGLAIVGMLIGAYAVAGWQAMVFGVPAVLLYLVVGVIPYLFALGSRVESKRRVRQRMTPHGADSTTSASTP
jgi:hypothetical protein